MMATIDNESTTAVITLTIRASPLTSHAMIGHRMTAETCIKSNKSEREKMANQVKFFISPLVMMLTAINRSDESGFFSASLIFEGLKVDGGK